jgi:hypothetical protein
MTNFSGIPGKVVQRSGGARFMVHWKARLFMADKVIHLATITSVFKTGFCLQFDRAVPLGTEMNVEFIVNFRKQQNNIRIKATVEYCLLRAKGDGADLDIITSKIDHKDHHLLGNVLQTLSENKEFNLRG